ncbi:Hypothetical_protein [Hexamita inflata]|uniref:Hypothetical_protein n=1 Tax=Hexamita inflata TaxID=28002 RepID=A0AA86QSP2_9EUKA|nr:Hypothetical protein HINF_LOCUS44965 [Hexamita inflata]
MVKINQYSCRQIPSCSPFTCSLQVNSRTVCRQFAGKRTITADPAEKGALVLMIKANKRLTWKMILKVSNLFISCRGFLLCEKISQQQINYFDEILGTICERFRMTLNDFRLSL